MCLLVPLLRLHRSSELSPRHVTCTHLPSRYSTRVLDACISYALRSLTIMPASRETRRTPSVFASYAHIISASRIFTCASLCISFAHAVFHHRVSFVIPHRIYASASSPVHIPLPAHTAAMRTRFKLHTRYTSHIIAFIFANTAHAPELMTRMERIHCLHHSSFCTCTMTTISRYTILTESALGAYGCVITAYAAVHKAYSITLAAYSEITQLGMYTSVCVVPKSHTC